MKQRNWVLAELHSHTRHSDGDFTVEQLISAAKRHGIEALALTDHNTLSGQEDQIKYSREYGIQYIRGMEYTTFHGHMLAMGLTRYTDWRFLSRDQIEGLMDSVHENGALVGIAHPFSIGNPICTGCRWEYDVKDFHKVDYIEVINRGNESSCLNKQAFEMWGDLLRQGYRIGCTAGSDWHRKDLEGTFFSTMIGIDGEYAGEAFEKHALQSVREGRLAVTRGPFMTISLSTEGKVFDIGDTAPATDCAKGVSVSVCLDYTRKVNQWKGQINTDRLLVQVSDAQGVVAQVNVPQGESDKEISLALPQAEGFVKAQLYEGDTKFENLVAFTAPVYIR